MSKLQLGDTGTWVGAIGTILAVVFAWWSGHKEAKKYRKRIEREQAEGVSAWVAGEKQRLPVKVMNRSGEPVYDLVLSVVLVQGAGPQFGKESPLQRAYKVLPPGIFMVQFNDYPGGGMHTKPGVELAFTDKQGLHWLKDKNGNLSVMKKSPTDYYGMSQPIGWRYFDDKVI